jgi:hypothetical protein
LRDRTDEYFEYEGIVNKVFLQHYGSPATLNQTIATVDSVMVNSGLETLPARLLGAHGDYLRVIDRNAALRDRPISLLMRGARAIGQRDFGLASQIFRRLAPPTADSLFLDAYATAMAGDATGASSIVSEYQPLLPDLPWNWLVERFGLGETARIDEGNAPRVR